MIEEYSFKVVKSESNNSVHIKDQVFIIEISPMNSFLTLRISNHLTVKSISIINYSNDYLAGYFGLRSALEVDSVLEYLILKINGESKHYNFASVKWEKFSDLFRRWFNVKLTPILDKEHELSQLLFEEL